VNKANTLKFIDKAIEINQQEAKEAGALGFMVRTLVQVTFPHSNPKTPYYERVNGNFTLTMAAGSSEIGLPYGTIPRLVMSWITTEAIKTKNRELILGDSLSGFLRELGLIPSGGRWGTITRIKNQMRRLCACSIIALYADNKKGFTRKLDPVEDSDLWWDPKDPEQGALFNSKLLLREGFFKEVINSSIVFRMDTLKLLKQSSMAVDIYMWVTYRNSYAKKPSRIPWEALQLQFGAGYPLTPLGKRNFKRMFIQALKKVAIVYHEAGKIRTEEKYLLFVPGKPDVPKKKLTALK
jgi:hypothetical protein